ncbi:hypothetical protein [Rhodococcus sp. NPDC057529]|uniref:hypothetical protein n=1 Tax=Rhodococcus sp. NPDC057529 TaxID=3346158 RepID=UPI00366EC09B
MVMIEGAGADEDKIAPTEAMLAAMSANNEDLVNAGIMLDGQGLKPTSAGARVVFEGGARCPRRGAGRSAAGPSPSGRRGHRTDPA